MAPFIATILAAAAVSGLACSRPSTTTSTAAIRPGGALVASVRGEVHTFNRFAARNRTDDIVALLIHSKLVRTNRATQEIEPWLAESWTRSDDGLRYTLKLRSNVTFSDGHPFTSDDVAFSFQAAYDTPDSPMNDVMQVGHKKLEIATPDALTVVITFPALYAPGLRILDNLPIVPRHKLDAALKAGTITSAWGVATPPSEIVVLGPFVVNQYTPGQRLVLTRNPHYWRKDASGTLLPYLDRVTIEIVTDQDAELLRLENGQLDMTVSEARLEDYAPLKRAADAGRVTLRDLGFGYNADGFWVNLKPGALGADPRAAWLQKDELRRAISMAVDRDAFNNTVFLGAGVPVYGPVTPANKKWFSPDVPRTPYDPAGAKTLLATIGLADRNGDGILEDARNQPVRFTLLTQKGNTARERGAMMIRDELKKIGVIVDVAPIDLGALVTAMLSGKYEALYFGIIETDTDPALNADFWFSFGSAHLWNIAQKTPATAWERQIDELMSRQSASLDEAERIRLFADTQKIFAEHLPVVYFVAPRMYVAASSRVINLIPALIPPQLLWSGDTLAVVH